MKNDTLPQFNANPCVQQSHLQIFLWRKGSYAYFADEKTDADAKTETSKKMVREWKTKTFTETAIKFRIWLLAQDSNHVRALTLWKQQKSNFQTFFWHY